MAMKPESRFVAKIKRDLDALTGLWYVKTQERSRRGVPDILCCYGGMFIAIEAKTSTGALDKLQAVTLNKIIKSGGIAFSTTPDSWPSHYRMLCTLWMRPTEQPILVEVI